MARQNGKREICGEKKRKLEREVEEENLVLLAQALLNGSLGLAHEAAVADRCCLAVCCSDMQDYTMCSQRARERERARAREGERKRERYSDRMRDEREGRCEVKGLK